MKHFSFTVCIFSVLFCTSLEAVNFPVKINDIFLGKFVDLVNDNLVAEFGPAEAKTILCNSFTGWAEGNIAILGMMDPKIMLNEFSRNLLHSCPNKLAELMVKDRKQLKGLIQNYYNCRKIEKSGTDRCQYDPIKASLFSVPLPNPAPATNLLTLYFPPNSVKSLGERIKENIVNLKTSNVIPLGTSDFSAYCKAVKSLISINPEIVKDNGSLLGTFLLDEVIVPMTSNCTDMMAEAIVGLTAYPWFSSKLAETSKLVLSKMFDTIPHQTCSLINSALNLSPELFKKMDKKDVMELVNKYAPRMLEKCWQTALDLGTKYPDLACSYVSSNDKFVINLLNNNPSMAGHPLAITCMKKMGKSKILKTGIDTIFSW